MEYKRQLGHRIYTREQFRSLLRRHRGPFHLSNPTTTTTTTTTTTSMANQHAESPVATAVEDETTAGGALALAPFAPLRPGDECEEESLHSEAATGAT